MSSSKTLKLLCLALICLQFSVKDSVCIECRHAVSMHFGRAKIPPFKREGSITCENEGQVCARVHVKGTIGSHRVSTHAASCINETLCNEDDFCSIGNLVNMSHVEPYTKVRSCSTKCCDKNNCNVHPKSTPHPRLQCYSGAREEDLDGNVIRDDRISRTCLFSAKGKTSSRCMLAKFSSTHSETNSSLETTVSYCVYKEMCESITCGILATELASQGGYKMGHCDITCCSTPLCNKSFSTLHSPVSILLALLLLKVHNC